MAIPLRLLIVEDSENDAQLILLALKRGGYDPIYERVAGGSDLEIALARHKWDIIVADQDLSNYGGLAALDFLRENGYDIPFILISSRGSEDWAAEAMAAGAQDYVMKDNLTRLCPAITRELKEVEVRRDHKRAEATVERQAHYDFL